jgi:TetR/AcrR family transcriptional repressor of bet genes
MPRVVDHEARRAEVAAVAADLIARRGLDVSVRDVAAAGGYSTTVVTHYFASKRELLLHAYRSAGFATERRLQKSSQDLLGICEAILPLDEPRTRTWQTWFAFWGAAVADEELAALQRRRLLWFRDLLARELGGDEEGARELLVLVRGIAAEAVFDPEDWPPERQRELVERTIRRLGHG